MNPERIGVMVNNLERDRLRAFAVAAGLGFKVVHTSALPESWLTGPEREHYLAAARDSGVTIASLFVGFDGQSYADFPSIRRTIGLTLPSLRDHRCQVTKCYSALAADIGAPSLTLHLGFLPPADSPDYTPLLEAIRVLADCCAEHRQALHFETGQDSADALLRLIQDVNRPNLGVNFDPANFLLYGSDEPLRALEILATQIRGVHCKDAIRSHEPEVLGTEVPLGEGEVDLAALLLGLESHGYRGPLVIERETGPNPVADILEARRLLIQGGSG